MDGLRPYPAYRDSGVRWLGALPVAWKSCRFRFLFREVDRRSVDGREVHLSMSQKRGLIEASEMDRRSLVSESYAGGKLCEPDDLVLNRLKAHLGVFSLAKRSGVVSPDYTVLRKIQPVLPQYFEHVLRSSAVRHELRVRAKGLVEGFWRLYTGDLYDIVVPVPPISEQAAIIRFLADMDRAVGGGIRACQRSIRLLEAQRRTVAEEAVTRGLRRNAPVKPSGSQWLGDMPAHWSVARLKFLTTHVIDCLHATPLYDENGAFPAIRTADVHPGRLLLGTARRVNESQYRLWTARLAPREGDILYTREGERFGIAATVPAGVDLCISQRMMFFRVSPPHSSRYLMWQMNCRHVYDQAAMDLLGTAAPHVNVDTIKNFWLLVPPPDEQVQIADRIDRAVQPIDIAIERERKQIALLRELRTRLVADVVTGQLDVREAAAQLPDLRPEDADLDLGPEAAGDDTLAEEAADPEAPGDE